MSNFKLDSIIIIVIMIVAKILGLIRDVFISKNYGLSAITDAYNISYIIAITIFGFIGVAITNSIVPELSKLFEKDKKKLFDLISNILNVLIIGSLILTFFCIIFSKEIVILIGGNLNIETINIAIHLVKISLFSIIFLTLNSILNAVLRLFNFYKTTTVASLVLNIPSILYLMIFSDGNIDNLTIALVLGYCVQCLIQIPALIKVGYKYRLIFNLKDKKLQSILKRMPSMIIASSVLQISTLFDNKMASMFGEGAISALSIANKLNGIMYTIFATSLIQIAYSQMAKSFGRYKDVNKVGRLIKENINRLIIIIIPTMISTFLLSKEIIILLFMRGNFDLRAVELSSIALKFYTVGLLFYIIRDIINYGFYAMDKRNIPVKIGIVSVGINIILNIILSTIYGISGITLATSISAGISCILLVLKFKKCTQDFQLFNYSDFLKVISGTFIIGILIIFYKNIIDVSFLNFILLIIITGFIYFAYLNLVKHSEFKCGNLSKIVRRIK